jgi:hypothetical protein
MSDVWTPGSTSEPAEPAATPLQLVSTLIDMVKNHFTAYLIGGLGFLLAILGCVIVLILPIGIGVLPGAITNDDDLTSLGLTIGFLVYGVGIAVLAFFVAPLLNASLMRAVWKQVEGEGDLSFGSAFSTMRDRMGPVLVLNVLTMVVVMIGLLMCYLPGLFAAMVLGLAIPMVAIHDVPPADAIRLTLSKAQQHFSWHVIYGLLSLAIALIVQYIPIIGMMLAYPVLFTYQVLAYRALWGAKGPPGYAT